MAVLGHSQGGEIVAAFAAKHPTHVDHLILVDAVPPKNPDPPCADLFVSRREWRGQ